MPSSAAMLQVWRSSSTSASSTGSAKRHRGMDDR
ncbi:Uncharacterised protein [Bordetella pertussis]|nr:Uncharacterised protein [Bordetella pertussis]